VSETVYRWKRFWCPRAKSISLADGGYLYDPDEKYGKAYNPHLVALDEILYFPCLILLGESGIGKSVVLAGEYERISNQIRSKGDEEEFLNLRSYGSEDRLIRDLFESNKFRFWQAGTHKLHIFLDSFDECPLGTSQLSVILIDKFNIYKNQLHRLYLRIACRTGAWPETLEKGLRKLWSQNSIGIYELAPLRRIDVTEAANKKNLAADLFLEEVSRNDLVSLALNPLTLNFLLNTYSKNNKKLCQREKVHELYRDGCEQLCTETNRIAYGLESKQRLIIAARIAAMTIFTNRSSIWTSLNQADITPEDIKLAQLSYGYETASSRDIEVTEKALREVLETGLFSACGPHQIGWAHKSYAEFLAAWYLVQHNLPLAQIKEIIFISNDYGNRVIPQLHGTVAWLASMKLDVLQEVIKSDPDIVLKSDIPMDECLRKEIVDKLLLKYEKGELYSYSLVEINNYKKLKHPSLASQLQSYIQNANQQIEARSLAIFIAQACDLSELQEDLLNLALDSSQPIDLREDAVGYLSTIADDSTKLKLKPLATEFLPEDQQDQLKGYVLHTLWPKLISSDELFKFLTPPKSPNWHGSYWQFVNFQLVQEIQPCDLVIALNWLHQQGIRYLGHPLERVGDSLLRKAWENLEYPGIVESFIRIALLQYQEYQSVVSNREIEDKMASQLLRDVRKRRFLIQKAISIMSEVKAEPYFLQDFLDKDILISEDIYWMLDNMKQSNSERSQYLWAKMIEQSFDRQDGKQIDAILVNCQSNNVLSKIFTDYFKSVDFNSDEEKNQRRIYQNQKYMECRKYQFKPQLLDPSPQDRILQCLGQLESGEIDSWWQLNLEMTLRPDSKFYSSDFGLDLTVLPGWQDSTENIRNRIVQGAKYYIQHQQDSISGWIGTDSYDRRSIAGCRALLLLLNQEPDFIQSLPSDIWKRWASVMIAMPGNDVRSSSYQVLVAHAYNHAPQECVDTLLIVLEREIQKYDSILVIRLFDQCWDSNLELAILEKLKDPKLTPKLYGNLLKELLEKGSNEARQIARDILSLPVSLDQECREKTLIISTVLLRDCDPISWLLIWSLFQRDELFGREVIETAITSYFDGIQLKLTDIQLADLYIWLTHQYPYEDNKETIIMFTRPEDYINELRRGIINQLINRGTQEACIVIQRLIQELPNLGWLKRVLVNAQAHMRRKAWQPLELEHIRQLISSTEKRLIQDGNHLLDILIESLGRLESKLQGETPAVRDLWDRDKVNKTTYRPLSENELSDYIKRFLEDDLKHRGIIVNREVEIRRNFGGNSGERTDIHIDAVLQNKDGSELDLVTVIIEVKGCWHGEIFSAMQSQLVGRYLADNPHACGLYLVGWFKCQQWDSKDSRYRHSKTKNFDLDTVKTKLYDQAQGLSSENLRVRAFVLNAALR